MKKYGKPLISRTFIKYTLIGYFLCILCAIPFSYLSIDNSGIHSEITLFPFSMQTFIVGDDISSFGVLKWSIFGVEFYSVYKPRETKFDKEMLETLNSHPH